MNKWNYVLQQCLLTLFFVLLGVLLYFGMGMPIADYWQWYALLFAAGLFALLVHDVRFFSRLNNFNQQGQRLLKTISAASPVIVWTADSNGVITSLRGRALKHVGWCEEDIVGKTLVSLVDKDPEIVADVRRVLKGETFVSFRHIRGRYYRNHYYPIVGSQGKTGGYHCISVDMSREMELDAKVQLSERIFSNTADAIIVADSRRRILSVNKAFTRITGYGEEEVLHKRLTLPQTEGQNYRFYRHIIRAIRKHGVWNGEVWARRKSGELFSGKMTLTVIKEAGAINNYVVFFADVTDLKRTQEELRYLANHDTLTGLPNRRLFLDRLDQGIKRAKRLRNRLAIYFIDLDNFKLINDTMGHAFGDELLKEVGLRLKTAVRESDTVARLAGDEFTVVAENVRDTSEVVSIAKKILSCFEEPFAAFGESLEGSASVGIGIYPNDGEDMSSLMKNADAAMYKAKAAGRNGFYYLAEDGVGHLPKTLFFPSELRLALKREQMELLYQPQVDLRNGEIVGCEALLRWNHHCRGQIMPVDFLPMAEETGMIQAIGEWALDEACRQLKLWRNRGVELDYVALNVAAGQITDPGFGANIDNALRRHELPPASLVLEVPEAVVVDNMAVVQEFIREMHELGVRCLIDGFGATVTNYGYLKHFPADIVKIDQRVLSALKPGHEKQSLIRALIGIADVLDMKIVAVGIERPSQEDILQEMGCHYGQGFLYAKPMTSDSFTKFQTGSAAMGSMHWKVG